MMDGMKPLHPRASQGLALAVVGIIAAAAGVFLYRRLDLVGGRYTEPDDPFWAFVLMAAGGLAALAGVIIYAASPARVDWQPPEAMLVEWRQGER